MNHKQPISNCRNYFPKLEKLRTYLKHILIDMSDSIIMKLYCGYLLKKGIRNANKENYQNAICYFNRIIKKSHKTKRAKSDFYIPTVINIGHSYYKITDYVNAEKLLKEGYAITDPETIDRTIVSMHLGTLFSELEKFKLAENYFIEAYSFLSNYKDSIYFKILTHNMAQLYVYVGSPNKVEQFLKESSEPLSEGQAIAENKVLALEISARRLIDEHNYVEAEAAFKEVIAHFNTDNLQTTRYAEILLYMTFIALQQKKADDILIYAQEAKNIFELFYGQAHVNIYRCIFYIGQAYWMQNKFDLATKDLHEAIDGIKKTMGIESSIYLTMLSALYAFYLSQNNNTKAEFTLLETIEAYSAITQKTFRTMSDDEKIAFARIRFNSISSVYNFISHK